MTAPSSPSLLTIRRGTVADFAAVKRLQQQLIDEPRARRPDVFRAFPLDVTEALFLTRLEEAGVMLHVAESDQVVVGYAITWIGVTSGDDWTYPRDMAFIRQIAVDNDVRRRGVGRQLYAAVEADARAAGAQVIALFVDATNARQGVLRQRRHAVAIGNA